MFSDFIVKPSQYWYTNSNWAQIQGSLYASKEADLSWELSSQKVEKGQRVRCFSFCRSRVEIHLYIPGYCCYLFWQRGSSGS